MTNKHYVFMCKKLTVVPQALEDEESGEVITGLLKQGFHVSPVHAQAKDSIHALMKFDTARELNDAAAQMVDVVLY